jgi:hypothetical protein
MVTITRTDCYTVREVSDCFARFISDSMSCSIEGDLLDEGDKNVTRLPKPPGCLRVSVTFAPASCGMHYTFAILEIGMSNFLPRSVTTNASP